jgi:hypothetical protein
MANFESRMQRIRQSLAARVPIRDCNCEGVRYVTIDAANRTVCDRCGGQLYGPFAMPEGSIPAPWHPDMKIEPPDGLMPPDDDPL